MYTTLPYCCSHVYMFHRGQPNIKLSVCKSLSESAWMWVCYYYCFSYDQAALRTVQSVCLSVHLSVRPSVCRHTVLTMFLSSYHHVIVRNNLHWQKWCSCKRLRSDVKSQCHRGQNKSCPNLTRIERFLTVTPVLIHRWLRNDAQSLKWHRRGALLFLRIFVKLQGHTGTEWSILTRIEHLWTVNPVWITDGLQMIHEAWSGIEGVTYYL